MQSFRIFVFYAIWMFIPVKHQKLSTNSDYNFFVEIPHYGKNFFPVWQSKAPNCTDNRTIHIATTYATFASDIALGTFLTIYYLSQKG